MLRKILQFSLRQTDVGKPLAKVKPLITAIDSFFYEVSDETRSGPHIRDIIDLKRWMILVVVSLVPCIIMSIWNSGMQKFVYGSARYDFLSEYMHASTSFSAYIKFAFSDFRFLTILKYGLFTFVPITAVSYMVGGFWEVLFASVRKHEISEGFLVTGILYALILPSTIPYWMVAVGVSLGTILGKELFGGTGMNIFNPALICRCILFFSFPAQMTGDIWVGTNPTKIKESVTVINTQSHLPMIDNVSTASPLNLFNISTDIKRVHVDAIASNFETSLKTLPILQRQFYKWTRFNPSTNHLGNLDAKEIKSFVTAPPKSGGLGLSQENYSAAYHFANLKYGKGKLTNSNFFFGNQIGSLGETSTFACLLGAIFLIWVGIGSWRTMLSIIIGALFTACLFQLGSTYLGFELGFWNPAKYDLPAYKHLLLGGLAFGLVFMATDPVSSPGLEMGKWIYGFLIGSLTIIIRVINPAFPEGVMLAILFGNAFAPLIDHISIKAMRKRKWKRAP